jgi:HK97 family phage portal protein
VGLFRRSVDVEQRGTFPTVTFDQLVAASIDSGGALPAPTVERILRHAAAWACIDVLSSTVRALPIDTVRRDGENRRPVTPPQLIVKPSPIVSRRVWLGQAVFSLATDGNAFGWADQTRLDTNGNPTSIEWFDPCRVPRNQRKVVDGIPQVTLNDNGQYGGDHQLWPFGPIFHVPGKMVPPGSPFALSPLEYAGASLIGGLEAEEFSARYFHEGGHPSAILSSDNPDLDEDLAKRIKAAFVAAIRPGRREPAVLGAGLTYSAIQVDPSNTQFLDMIRWTVEQACRVWHVPPAMIYAAVSGQNVTYTNATVADLHYLKHSVEDYLTNFEDAFEQVTPTNIQTRFNRDAFLRADPMARAQLHKLRLETKTRTVDEVRGIEDEAPFGGLFAEPGIPGAATEATPADEARQLAEIIQKIYLGVGVVLTEDEARDIANRAGAGLTGAGPAALAPTPPPTPQGGS